MSATARTVLVIHGAGEPRRRGGKVYWELLLANYLGTDYVVKAPRMPRPDDPQHAPWARRIDELIATTTAPAVVGHSFGASVLLKYLAEAASRPVIAGLFLIATPYWGPDFPDFALPPDFAARLYARALPRAIVRAFDGRGHEFDQPQFPELVADIRRLVPPERAV